MIIWGGGISDEVSVDDIRQNISIEGIIPEDALERITVINQMAEDDSTYYEKILDVSYYPAQYVVYLNKLKGLSESKTSELLNAVLAAYKDWFLDTYANTAVLTITGNLVNYADYDYMEAVDLIATQINIMQNYVEERNADAPDFRSSTTGLAFSDISASLSTIESIDLVNLQSYVESNNVTKDHAKLINYYNYNLQKYNLDLSVLQSRLSDVQATIDAYEKDPVVVINSQDAVQEIEQTNEYYDTLIAQKLSISASIAEVNSKISKTSTLLANLQEKETLSDADEISTADEMLSSIVTTLTNWIALIEETTDEYYDTALFSGACKISIPAQYQAAGGLKIACKTVGMSVGTALIIVVLVWCFDGLLTELHGTQKRSNCQRVSVSEAPNKDVEP